MRDPAGARKRRVGVETADTVLEAPHHRHVDAVRVAGVEPPDGPAQGAGVERAQRGGPVHAGRQVEQVVVDVALAAEQGLHGRVAIEGLPFVVAGQALAQAPVMHAPMAVQKVEVTFG